MSHSKFRKKGRSLYIERWNPAAQKYVVQCCLCRKKGYSSAIMEPDFCIDPERIAIHKELTQLFPSSLSVDEFGRCADCVRMQDQ